MTEARRRVSGALALCAALAAAPALADEPPPATAPQAVAPLASASTPATSSSIDDATILGPSLPRFLLESFRVMYTQFNQDGRGYQSRIGPPGGPGSEQATIYQPQIEAVVKQGEHITHRLWIPIDIVTAASPHVDAVSSASTHNEAASLDLTSTYKKGDGAAFVHVAVHEEANYGSWVVGLGGSWSFLEDNTVVSANLTEVYDWFDAFYLLGGHAGHLSREATSANVGLTQLLSPTTIAHLEYGYTLQLGMLSNGWNTVPTPNLYYALESVPAERNRNAVSLALAQYLPWDGALHGSYRFYVDDWAIRAHTLELELHQRVTRSSRIRFLYRYHAQTGASFYTTNAPATVPLRTSDSDLAPLSAQTLGFKGSFDLKVPFARGLTADVYVERYWRSNDLHTSILGASLGWLF